MSQTMTLSTIRSEAQTFLMNTSTDVNSLSWGTAELNDYINEAVYYTQQVTEYFEDMGNLTCTSSVGTYTASNNVYQFKRLTWDREFLPMTTFYELDRDDPNWRTGLNAQSPFRCYFPQMQQNYLIGLYPVPSNSGTSYSFGSELGVTTQVTDSGGVNSDPNISITSELGVIISEDAPNAAMVQFRPDLVANPFTSATGDEGVVIGYSTDEGNIGYQCVRIPDTLSADTDVPQLPAECHYGLVMYVLMRCFLREGEFQDLNAAKAWFGAYGDWMEGVLEAKKRRWPTRVSSLEPFEEGSLFQKRLNAIGYPMQLDLQPSYGT